jgi:hypothetical protein
MLEVWDTQAQPFVQNTAVGVSPETFLLLLLQNSKVRDVTGQTSN